MAASTVVGKLELVALRHEGFREAKDRTLRIWTPDQWSGADLPVIYMFDGQNLFDDATSFVGEWHVDETIEEGIKAGKQAFMVVGLDNSADRTSEYIPDEYSGQGTLGETTMKFLVESVIPYVESHYQVRNDQRSIGGSSLGALMTLFAYQNYNNIFSNYLIFSPCLFDFSKPNPEQVLYREYFKKVRYLRANKKIFLSVGGKGFEAEYLESARTLKTFFASIGYNSNNFLYRENIEYEHNEKQWSKFFVDAYDFIA